MFPHYCSIFNSGKRPERLRVSCSPAYDPRVDDSSVTSTLGGTSSNGGAQEEEKILGKNDEYKLVKLLKKRLSREGGSFVAMSRLFEKMDLDGNGVVDFEDDQEKVATIVPNYIGLSVDPDKVRIQENYLDGNLSRRFSF